MQPTRQSVVFGLFLAITALAASVRAQDKEDVFFRDLVAAQSEEPRLRIDSGGHIGVVHALAFTPDSVRLCSAGTDKTVEVWNTSALARDLTAVYLHERTIRWQVARGPLGHVYALAVDPKEGLIAMAGHGAMTSLGEILLVDPKTGRLVRALEGHHQTVSSLDFSPDGQWLVSADLSGQTILWHRGEWKPETLYEPDEKQYGPAIAKQIQASGVEKRLAIFAGKDRVLVPIYDGRNQFGWLDWRLQEVHLPDRGKRGLDTTTDGAVTALAASADGSLVACAMG